MTLDGVEYYHYQGNKLSQRQLDDKIEAGWTVLSHVCNADDIHTYVFKRPKESQ